MELAEALDAMARREPVSEPEGVLSAAAWTVRRQNGQIGDLIAALAVRDGLSEAAARLRYLGPGQV